MRQPLQAREAQDVEIGREGEALVVVAAGILFLESGDTRDGGAGVRFREK